MTDRGKDTTTTNTTTNAKDESLPKRRNAESESPPKRRKPGRPKKKELSPKRGPGRPKGDAAVIKEYTQRMLASPRSAKVLDAVFDAALDPEHKHQAAAWKLVLDRIAPLKAFEQEVTRNSGKSAITINITGVGDSVSISGSEEDSSEEAVEAEFSEVTEGGFSEVTEGDFTEVSED